MLNSNRNILSTYCSVNKVIKHFGNRTGLQNLNGTVGDVTIVTDSIGFSDSEGQIAQHTRWIYYPIHGCTLTSYITVHG